jgi:serine/threonine protein kinase
LIDFGAVKEVTTQLLDNTDQSAFTIGIGTKGYAPNEQCLGRPQYSSDIYALGMIGIKALTGISPHGLIRDMDGDLVWIHKAEVSPALAAILDQMTADDPRQRYRSASEVLAVLGELANGKCLTTDLMADNPSANSSSWDTDVDTSSTTTPWMEELDEDCDSASSTSIIHENNQQLNDRH